MKRSRARGTHRRRPIVESLESRRVMAAALDGGVLTIEGTDDADRIVVRQRDDQLVVRVSGEESQSFASVDVESIVINALGGNDRIAVGSRVEQDAVVNAGDGRDKVRTGPGDDLIDGGAGRDIIHSGRGDDTVLGGEGRDIIISGKGDDVVDGGDDNDRLFAGKGADMVSGGLGDDLLVGNSEEDILDGGEGENRIIDNSQRDRPLRPRHIVRGRLVGDANRPERVFNRLDKNDDELITQDEVSENLWSRLGEADTDDVEGVSLDELLELLESRDRDRPRGPRPGRDANPNSGDDADTGDEVVT